MKIVAVLGSPRPQGNSSTLAQKFLDAAQGLGAQIQTFRLNELNYQGCQGCLACKTTSQACIQEDDLAAALDAVKGADILLLASPVYYGDISGQLKCFFDRTFSYLNPDFSSRVPGGKKAVVVLAQAQPEAALFDDIFPRYERWLKLYGYAPVHLLRAVGVRDVGEIARKSELLDQAAALARELVQ